MEVNGDENAAVLCPTRFAGHSPEKEIARFFANAARAGPERDRPGGWARAAPFGLHLVT